MKLVRDLVMVRYSNNQTRTFCNSSLIGSVFLDITMVDKWLYSRNCHVSAASRKAQNTITVLLTISFTLHIGCNFNVFKEFPKEYFS